MKVLHVDTGRSWYGAQQQVLYLTRGLEERGIVSVVATPQGSPMVSRLRSASLPLIELPPSPPYTPKTVRALQKILADRTWHLLHAHSAHAHTMAFLGFRLPPPRPFHRPSFVISRRVDFMPARDPLTRLKYTSGGQHYLCVSNAVQSVLRSYGVPEAALSVVHSGVPAQAGPVTPRSRLRAELGVPEDAFLIGGIGPMQEHKGLKFLVEAMPGIYREAPRAHLLLLGGGDQEPDLTRQVRKLSLTGQVTFGGSFPDPNRFLPALDLFVLPSLEEALGLRCLNAQAAGIPVVATRVGGIPEAVDEGGTGLLVHPSNPGGLADAVLTLWKDPSLRERMAKAGPKWVAERFTVDGMVEKTLAVYRQLLGSA